MFKHITLYRTGPDWAADLAAIEEALGKAPFAECGATQQKAIGFVPPRGEANGALVEALGGEQTAPEPAAPLLEVDGPDPMYDNAVAVVLKHGKASISLVQRHLRIGYNHAARLLEAMEKTGVVSYMNDLGQRTVLKGGAA